MNKSCCLQNQYSQMLAESKCGFNQNASNLGRWGTQCSLKTTSKDSTGPWKAFKGKQGGNLSESLR